jgi:pimeloyl-ACP methyl ester carboxylesterase
VLYLHGTTDGCHGVTKEQVERVKATRPARTRADRGVGHFMLVERPEEINKRITDWLARTS